MTCHFPIPAYLGADGAVKFQRREAAFGKPGFIHLPCGLCFGCKADRAREWAIRSYHEAQMHDESIFVTLTYAPQNLPPAGSLAPRDLQLFFKRMRRRGYSFRYFACGEYGDQRLRPHYHACMFGLGLEKQTIAGRSEAGHPQYFNDDLSAAWSLGRATFADFHPDAARYTAHYTAKKLGSFAQERIDPETGLKPYERMEMSGEIVELKREFQRSSLKPALGMSWLEKHWREVFPADSVVMQGKEYPPPRAYWKWLKDNHPEVADRVKRKRIAETEDRPYLTGHRLKQIQECAERKIDSLVRPTHKEIS